MRYLNIIKYGQRLEEEKKTRAREQTTIVYAGENPNNYTRVLNDTLNSLCHEALDTSSLLTMRRTI